MTSLNSHLQLAMLKRKKARNAFQKGFTLVELLVVVVILGVLSGTALPQLLGAKDAADEKASLASANGMAKECANFVRFGGTAPAYISNELVTVNTDCSTTGGVFATAKDQSPGDGDLCINTPNPANNTTNKTCTITVDSEGGLTGAWS